MYNIKICVNRLFMLSVRFLVHNSLSVKFCGSQKLFVDFLWCRRVSAPNPKSFSSVNCICHFLTKWKSLVRQRNATHV